ncbi:hypothetical protein COOONC_28439 [Cooperia oncophora]
MVTAEQPKQKTEKELKKEAEKAAKLAKFEEKQRKLQEKAAAATAKPKEEKVAKKKVVAETCRPKLIFGKSTGEKKDVSAGLLNVYDPGYVESDWYAWWEKEGFFKPEYGRQNPTKPNPKGSFTICIPPPNVTGTLHVGHALATTVEDTLTRWSVVFHTPPSDNSVQIW